MNWGLDGRTVVADTHGNTDIYEASSPISSPWWSGSALTVSQRYGCTTFLGEPDLAPGFCPFGYKKWHQGIDIPMNTGTAIYSQFDGTTVASQSGVLGFRTSAGNIVYLLHGYCVGAFCNIGQTVHVGDELITSACVPPSGGSCTAPHLHLEVHKSVVGELSVPTGPGDDINPEEWLNTQCTVTSAANSLAGLQGVIGSGSYLNWYDNASPGFIHDTVHVLNPTGSNHPVTVTLAGATPVQANLTPGQEWYTSFPQKLGGPVSISRSDLLASRRTQYYNAFNETNAISLASTDQFLPWFDKASSGFCADTVHVTNPSSVAANVTIRRQGNAGNDQMTKLIPAGQGAYFSWPAGTIGGPIEVLSDQLVMASERIDYMHSFSENNAIPAANVSQHVWFSWYDNNSHEVFADEIHVVNPTATDCVVNISAPGIGTLNLSVPRGADQYAHFGPSSLGGPIKVDVDLVHSPQCPGILAFERTMWNGFFSQVDGMPTSLAATQLMFNWYDNASAGMVADNIHLSNPSALAAWVTVTVPGAPTQYVNNLASGGFAVAVFPLGTIGGPVTIVSSQPVLASERVQFYSSFHEVDPLGFP